MVAELAMEERWRCVAGLLAFSESVMAARKERRSVDHPLSLLCAVAMRMLLHDFKENEQKY